MANPYFIKIELPAESGTSSVAGNIANTSEEVTPVQMPGAAKVARAAKRLVSFAAVASTADKIISFEISQVSLRTGANEYEQRLNVKYSIGRQIMGAGAALAGAAMVGGPAGVAVAAIGIAANGINKLVGIAQNQERLNEQRSLENVSIGMQIVRAGTSGRRSSNQ